MAVTDIGSTLTSTEKQQLQKEARLIVDLLQNYHYSGRTFREIENRELIANYLNALDPQADFFTKDDGESLSRRFEHSLKSVYVFRGDVQPGFEIFDRFSTRIHKRMDWIARRLDRGFDFTADESFVENSPETAPLDPAALDARWELILKNLVLREIVLGRSYTDAVATVSRRYTESRRNLDALDALAVRERFLDAIIRSYDPHSGYFSADSAREFAVEMDNAIAGIGLDLRKEKGLCIVTRVQPGGPADLKSDLAADDTLEAVASGDETWTETDKIRLQEIVGKIRGDPGTHVRLAYRKNGGGDRIEVTLERARVVLADERVHGAISTVVGPDGKSRPVGWVALPSFYSAGEGEHGTSAARDARELIESMKAAGVEGLVMDLRGNPGGTLTEAAAFSSLFLPTGTIMFSRGPDGKPHELAVTEGQQLYTGPLVVLTSSQSASASEIFSGAMKFHRRALIVGETATFGKGTAQAYIELAKTRAGEREGTSDWGTLRLTTDRFYLPNGGAVQHDGVASDVVLPSPASAGRQREADLPHALPAESFTPPHPIVPAANNSIPLTEDMVARLRRQAEDDVKSLPEWSLWLREQEFSQSFLTPRSRSLKLEVRQQEWAATEAKLEAMRLERRTLATQSAFATRPLEIASVQAAATAHEAKLRAALKSGALPGVHRLHQSAFLVEDDRGLLEELRLDAVNFTDFSGDREALATTLARETGRPFFAENMRTLLQNLSLLEQKTEETVVTAIQSSLGADATNPETARRGGEALLARMTEIDRELLCSRPSLDVPLRESLRLTADWASRAGPSPAQP